VWLQPPQLLNSGTISSTSHPHSGEGGFLLAIKKDVSYQKNKIYDQLELIEQPMIDPRLESDSTFITAFELCQVRLNHNAAFPWVLLIPQQEGISEIIDLSSTDQQVLMQEIALTSQAMKRLFQPTKLNVANLGNVVPQLHVHIIARYKDDQAWPGPVWNSGVSQVYEPKHMQERITQLKEILSSLQS
jgi:diadenosine tetraphosphate (Ap4A) HIT family hydrolase